MAAIYLIILTKWVHSSPWAVCRISGWSGCCWGRPSFEECPLGRAGSWLDHNWLNLSLHIKVSTELHHCYNCIRWATDSTQKNIFPLHFCFTASTNLRVVCYHFDLIYNSIPENIPTPSPFHVPITNLRVVRHAALGEVDAQRAGRFVLRPEGDGVVTVRLQTFNQFAYLFTLFTLLIKQKTIEHTHVDSFYSVFNFKKRKNNNALRRPDHSTAAWSQKYFNNIN